MSDDEMSGPTSKIIGELSVMAAVLLDRQQRLEAAVRSSEGLHRYVRDIDATADNLERCAARLRDLKPVIAAEFGTV